MFELHIDAHGPIFDRMADREIDAFLEQAKDDVAAQAHANVAMFLNAQIRNPTPYYETQIITQRAGADRIVHDRGIIYGPWLEGVGSRNRTTRFKGYASFRKAFQQTEREAPALLQRTLQPYLERMR